MSVNNSWLVDVNVSINTTTAQVPTFNNCALVGVMPTQASPYQSPPSSWSGAIYQNYTSLATLQNDFLPCLQGAETAGDLLAADRFEWLLNAASAYFSQIPSPAQVYVFGMPTETSASSYTTIFNNFTAVQNNFYGFSICDLILANSYSTCVVQLTTNAGATIPAGTAVTPKTASSYYTLLQPYTVASAGNYLVPFYSLDATTSIPMTTFSAVSPAIAAVTAVTNLTAAVVGKPGYVTPTTGVCVALASLRAASNQKKFFADFNDYTQSEAIQAGGGSEDLTCFYHSLNLQGYNATTAASLAAACLGSYFTQVFVGNNGLTQLSSSQLQGQPTDPSVTTSNIGSPGVVGSSTNLIGWNNNVYPGFGGSNLGLVQYGYQSNSTATAQVYLDQVVGADYTQFNAQANLLTLLLDSLPSGIPYSNVGIQQILTSFKNSIQQSVNQNILQPISNSNFTYSTYQQVQAGNPSNIANRIYNSMTFTGAFLSRIQMIKLQVNLTL